MVIDQPMNPHHTRWAGKRINEQAKARKTNGRRSR